MQSIEKDHPTFPYCQNTVTHGRFHLGNTAYCTVHTALDMTDHTEGSKQSKIKQMKKVFIVINQVQYSRIIFPLGLCCPSQIDLF